MMEVVAMIQNMDKIQNPTFSGHLVIAKCLLVTNCNDATCAKILEKLTLNISFIREAIRRTTKPLALSTHFVITKLIPIQNIKLCG